VYQDQGKYADADALFQRALTIMEAKLGKDDPELAVTLNNLAVLFDAQGKHADAEAFYQRALAIQEAKLGKDHPDVADTLRNLANVYQEQGKYADAEMFYQRALVIQEAKLGKDHPDVAAILDNLSTLKAASGDLAAALVFSRRAGAGVIAHAATETGGAQQAAQSGGLIEQRADYFRRHVATLALAQARGVEPAPPLGREGFEIAQWALQSSAGAAVQQMAARSAAAGGALGALVREQQDLAATWRASDKALIEALSKPDGQRNQTLIDNIRKQIADAESRLATDAARLQKDFPDYAALALPTPLKVEEAQKLLGADEALAFFLTDDKASYVFALTRDSFDWKVIPLGGDALAQKVAAFRRGLDVDQLEAAISAAKKPELFDLGLANELYASLLGPVEALVKNKKQLLVVSSGALTALPFHLLVTDKPNPPTGDFASYRDADWLIKRQAVTMLPSVASLKALRGFAGKERAAKPMVGFGDPLFDPNAAPASVTRVAVKAAARSLTTRSYTDFFKGVGVDRDKLAQSLAALPETGDELRAVAKDLGAPVSDIHLGRDASVTTVKKLPLADYRVVYFATHGLVAGDVKGLGEPSLALSIPAHPSDLDNGLLTASEVAQLKLNADWVVLSACNTVAGDKPGAEALSGLARAFFYAGARALLVSHWAVDSEAATRLTTATFDILKANPTIGRAEALRRAILAYLNDPSKPYNAYPALWGPFEIVGEGSMK
jgi:CHAT domain-containing protein